MKQRIRVRKSPPLCFANGLRHLAAYAGIEDASAAFGVDRSTLDDSEAMIPITVYYDAIEQAAARSGQVHFGFRFALRWTKVARDGISAMHFLMLSSPTLRVACEHMLRYQRYWNPAESYEMVTAGPAVGIRFRCWGPTREAHVHQAEKTAAMIVVVARSADPQCLPVGVAFPHARRGEDAELTKLFGVAPTYGAPWTEVTLPTAVMDRPLPSANPGLFDFMDRYVRKEIAARPPDNPSFAGRVFAVVQRLLHEGDVRQEVVAGSLGVGPRTLARRLAEENTTLRELVDAVRKGRAEALLESDVAIAEIAFLLGYSEPAAFQHAFRRWHGVSPNAWREKRGAPLTIQIAEAG